MAVSAGVASSSMRLASRPSATAVPHPARACGCRNVLAPLRVAQMPARTADAAEQKRAAAEVMDGERALTELKINASPRQGSLPFIFK